MQHFRIILIGNQVLLHLANRVLLGGNHIQNLRNLQVLKANPIVNFFNHISYVNHFFFYKTISIKDFHLVGVRKRLEGDQVETENGQLRNKFGERAVDGVDEVAKLLLTLIEFIVGAVEDGGAGAGSDGGVGKKLLDGSSANMVEKRIIRF